MFFVSSYSIPVGGKDYNRCCHNFEAILLCFPFPYLMKLILLLFSCLVFAQSSIAQSMEWQTTKLCSDCRPWNDWFANTSDGHIYVTPVEAFYPVKNFVTSDGGSSWRVAKDLPQLYNIHEIHNVFSVLDPSTIFWRDKSGLLYSTDSGSSWERYHMFPVQKFLKMSSPDSGIGLLEVKNQDKQFDIQLRATEDRGAYWYTELGQAYTRSSPARDAAFLSDSIVVVLHAGDFDGELMRTSDRGNTWQSVLRSAQLDSVLFENLIPVVGTEILLLETSWNERLKISYDRGSTWTSIPAFTNGFTLRTRVNRVNEGMLLWSAVGPVYGNATENLLNPDWDQSYAYSLLLSKDTGRSWEQVSIPGIPDGSRIFDIIPIANRMVVISWKDSATYVSSAIVGDLLSLSSPESASPSSISVYPNPVEAGEMISIENSDLSWERLILKNVLGQTLDEFDSANVSFAIPKGLTPGSYLIHLIARDQRVATSKLIVQ